MQATASHSNSQGSNEHHVGMRPLATGTAGQLWVADGIRHSVGRLSLLHGWFPVVVELVAVLLLVWSTRLVKGVLPALAAGVALALWAHWYIASVGVAGGPAPRRLWIWIGLSGFAFAGLILGWRRARWRRRGLAVVAVLGCLSSSALAMNAWVGYFPSVHAAWNQLVAGPLPDETDRLTVTTMQLTGARPSRGVVVPVTIGADASRFPHRRELVYLPPAWFASNPPPRLPTVMMISAELNTPADWLRAGGAVDTVDGFAAAHGGSAPVLVFVDATGAFDNDTECVNGRRGNAADHLTKDVVPYMASNFGVSSDRANWGIVGWSMGGTCAVTLTVRNPEIFSAFVDISGDIGPNSGTKAQTIDRLFGGDAGAWAAFDPTTIIVRHGHYSGIAGWFDVAGTVGKGGAIVADRAGNPESQDVAARSTCALALPHGIRCAVVAQPGRHDWPFAAGAFAAALPWLAGRLGTPEVPRTTLPGLAPDTSAVSGRIEAAGR